MDAIREHDAKPLLLVFVARFVFFFHRSVIWGVGGGGSQFLKKKKKKSAREGEVSNVSLTPQAVFAFSPFLTLECQMCAAALGHSKRSRVL